jgi:hypothetical protein
MDNPEKPATQGTQDEEKQNTIHYVLDKTKYIGLTIRQDLK